MEPLFYTLSGFSEKSGKSIDELLIMGRMGQIAFCIDIDPYNGDWFSGTISINDDVFNSLPDKPEDTIPDYVFKALRPDDWEEKLRKLEKELKENPELQVKPSFSNLGIPKNKRLTLPNSVTDISGKWYRKNLKTGEIERSDIPPKLHNPDGYGCYGLSGLYQIPRRCINRKAGTYATNVVFPYGRSDLGIELQNIKNPGVLFPVLSGNLKDIVIPADELKKIEVGSQSVAPPDNLEIDTQENSDSGQKSTTADINNTYKVGKAREYLNAKGKKITPTNLSKATKELWPNSPVPWDSCKKINKELEDIPVPEKYV